MILGITGTRKGMTPAQRDALPGLIAVLPDRVLHGGAVGVDEEVDAFLAPLYSRQYPNGRPPLNNPRFMTACDYTAYVESLPIRVYPVGIGRYNHWRFEAPFTELRVLHNPDDNPLHRNRIIAEGCDHLLAFPATAEEELRSGTWATVRYARAVSKPITIVGPDGSVRGERP